MDLTHFTDARYLPYILGSGVIIPTESNIGAQGEASRQGWNPSGAHFGPDVVWLTTGDAISSGITVGPDKKGSGKVTARVPDEDAVHWPIWARQQGIDERWYQALGQSNDPEAWWVVERSVPSAEWTAVFISHSITDTKRNEVCPCGSGKKFKVCHLGKFGIEERIWKPGDPIRLVYTEDDIRSRMLNAKPNL